MLPGRIPGMLRDWSLSHLFISPALSIPKTWQGREEPAIYFCCCLKETEGKSRGQRVDGWRHETGHTPRSEPTAGTSLRQASWDPGCFESLEQAPGSSLWAQLQTDSCHSSLAENEVLPISGCQQPRQFREHQKQIGVNTQPMSHSTVMAWAQTPVSDWGLTVKFNMEVLIKEKPPCFKRFIHFFSFFKKGLLVTEWFYSSE